MFRTAAPKPKCFHQALSGRAPYGPPLPFKHSPPNSTPFPFPKALCLLLGPLRAPPPLGRAAEGTGKGSFQHRGAGLWASPLGGPDLFITCRSVTAGLRRGFTERGILSQALRPVHPFGGHEDGGWGRDASVLTDSLRWGGAWTPPRPAAYREKHAHTASHSERAGRTP